MLKQELIQYLEENKNTFSKSVQRIGGIKTIDILFLKNELAKVLRLERFEDDFCEYFHLCHQSYNDIIFYLMPTIFSDDIYVTTKEALITITFHFNKEGVSEIEVGPSQFYFSKELISHLPSLSEFYGKEFHNYTDIDYLLESVGCDLVNKIKESSFYELAKHIRDFVVMYRPDSDNDIPMKSHYSKKRYDSKQMELALTNHDIARVGYIIYENNNIWKVNTIDYCLINDRPEYGNLNGMLDYLITHLKNLFLDAIHTPACGKASIHLEMYDALSQNDKLKSMDIDFDY